ncbi:MAG: hypothetical protein ABI573_01135 [Chloroflexota bacterium]
MADLPDPRLESSLRAALRHDADAVPLTLRAEAVEQAWAMRVHARRRRRLVLLASAAVLVIAVSAGALASLDRLIGTVGATQTPSTTPIASPSLPVVQPSLPLVQPSLPDNLIGGTLLWRERSSGPGAIQGNTTGTVPAGTSYLALVVSCSGSGAIPGTIDGVAFVIPCEPAWFETFVPPLGGTFELTLDSGDLLWAIIELRAVPPGGPTIAFVPPVASLTGADHSVPGYAGCGLGFTLPDGNSAADQCGPSWMPIPDDRALRVAPGDRISISLPTGWTVTGLGLAITAHDGIEPSGRGPTVTETLDPQASLPIGDWGLRADVSATGADGTMFGVPYYFRLIVAP